MLLVMSSTTEFLHSIVTICTLKCSLMTFMTVSVKQLLRQIVVRICTLLAISLEMLNIDVVMYKLIALDKYSLDG